MLNERGIGESAILSKALSGITWHWLPKIYISILAPCTFVFKTSKTGQ